ncbi:MAG: hypothetical protein H7Z72_13145 [Bacteroidetes bacterium]|nr:hypothetical protein [Fibrella sp.]
MYRLLLFFGGCLLAGCLVSYTSAACPAPQRYNVLFIATDDWKPLAGCYGTPQIKTPNTWDKSGLAQSIYSSYFCS